MSFAESVVMIQILRATLALENRNASNCDGGLGRGPKTIFEGLNGVQDRFSPCGGSAPDGD